MEARLRPLLALDRSTVATPIWVWQKLQSWLETLMSSWEICASVLAAMPVAALAEVVIVELVSPAGRLFLVPELPPPPLTSPWHSWQVRASGADVCSDVDWLQALPIGCASA